MQNEINRGFEKEMVNITNSFAYVWEREGRQKAQVVDGITRGLQIEFVKLATVLIVYSQVKILRYLKQFLLKCKFN